MHRYKTFILRLKPYKRQYRLFVFGCFIVCAFLFQLLMYVLSYAVPHTNGAFHYYFGGFHQIVKAIGGGGETNACRGFLVAGTLLGYIPILCVIPFVYFTAANWLIFEKISNRFLHVSARKYKKWALMIHFATIAIVFLVITGIFMLVGGYNPFTVPQAVGALGHAFDDNFATRSVGIAGCLHFGVGYVFALIDIFWLLGLAIAWVFRQIAKFFHYIGELLAAWKQRRLEVKMARREAKLQNKQNGNE